MPETTIAVQATLMQRAGLAGFEPHIDWMGEKILA